jgi:protease I
MRIERSNREGIDQMPDLKGKNVAMILAPQFEDVEATDPKEYLESHGATVTVVGLTNDDIEGKKGAKLKPDATVDSVSVDQFDALIIPGGGAPENLRINDDAVSFTRKFVESGKPVASICHGPQLLISAEVLRGKTVTCVAKIRDDVKNAGAIYVDEEVTIDENLITSRTPPDIPAFNEAIAKSLAGVTA